MFSPVELIESLSSLSRVSRSDAVFDLDKLLWINGQHIRRSSNADLADQLGSYWSCSAPGFDMTPSNDQVAQVTPLVRERLKTLRDAAPLVEFVFSNKISVKPDDIVQRGMDPHSTGVALRAAHQGLADLETFDAPVH